MLTFRQTLVAGASALLSFAAAGCGEKSIPARVTAESVAEAARQAAAATEADKAAIAAALEGGELVTTITFGGGALPEGAVVQRLQEEAAPATWRVEGDWLRNDDAKNQGLWLKAIPEGDDPVRIEFRARSVNPPKKRAFPGDIKIEAFATKAEHEAGYSFINGGWNNQFDTIARLGEHSADDRRTAAKPVKEGQVYRYAILRRGDRLDWLRDGELLYTYVDKAPVRGTWIGFNNWLSDVSFAELKVYRLPR